jgi:hypothetical protein
MLLSKRAMCIHVAKMLSKDLYMYSLPVLSHFTVSWIAYVGKSRADRVEPG